MTLQKNIDVRAADNIRVLAAAMVEKAQSGHPGGPMGGADFIHILYAEFLNFDPDDMLWTLRDRFFLDPGHMSPMMYAQLYLWGKYSQSDLENFRQWGSPTPGHPEIDVMRGIENTSGPLGQGHVMGVGAAIAERFLVSRFGEWLSHKIFAYISDGGIQEEISQGAGRIAGFLGLSNFVMFYDANDVQLSHNTDVVTHEDTARKYEAWGWKVITIDGHDHTQIREALQTAINETERPTLIIGKTVMGKGALNATGEVCEGDYRQHGQPLSHAGVDVQKTILNLGGNPESPFTIFDDVQIHYQNLLEKKRKIAQHRKQIQQNWENENPEKSQQLKSFFSGKAPLIDFSQITQGANQATRNASATVLGVFAEKIGNMIVSSADLCNSDKTDGFLKKSKAFQKGDFSGAFLQAGVAEFTMAAIANGMALHGSIIPVIGTFFVFSDYMKPAVRLAALMGLPVKYVWTHDAFRVGEDGPTHQPIEQEAQIRLLEQIKNHSGKRSLLALRPADSNETTVAWKMALENTDTPTALILSRQNIRDVTTYEIALQAQKGAYVLKTTPNPDVILIANGSEVATILDAAQLLEERDGLQVNVVSVISEGLFREQESTYQQNVISTNIPIFGLTAGLPSTLQGLVGAKGKVMGMTHFGYSAPAKVLDEKFGYTGENVYLQVQKYLSEYQPY